MHLRHGTRRLVILAVLSTFGSTRAFAQVTKAQNEHPEVERLTFDGVHEADVGELSQSVATEGSHCAGMFFKPFCLIRKAHYWYHRRYLDHKELARDVLRIKVFYWKRGFRDTDVDTVVTDRGVGKVGITFKVTEGPPTRVSTITIEQKDSLLSERSIARLVRLKTRAPLNLLRLDTTVVNLTNALWDRGYSDAIVDTNIVVDTAAKTAALTIRIDPRWIAHIGTIRIKGNEDVSDALIRKILRVNEGDLYRRADVIESQRALFESGLFRRTAIVVPPQGNEIKLIELAVTEAPPRLARISTGLNTVEFGQVDGRFTNFNFLGAGRRLDVQAGIGNLLAQQLNGSLIFRDITSGLADNDASTFLRPTYVASVDFQERWFGSPRNTLGTSVFAHRRSAPNVYVDRGIGASATFTREVSRRAPISMLYRYEVTRVEAGDVYFCVNYGICDLRTIGALRDRQRLSPFAFTASAATFDDPLDPSTGYQLKGEMETASSYTLSDFRYNRFFADGSVYRNMGLRRVLAGHARVGFSKALRSTASGLGVDSLTGIGEEILHPRKRFYAGGSASVRGYGENMLGPKVLTIAPSKLVRRVADDNTVVFPGCAPDIASLTIDAVRNCTLLNHPGLTDGDFVARPSGGSALIEGSIEYRFPIIKGITGAAFIDGAILGQGSLRASRSAAAITPGAGIRYYTPIGPVRFDVGYNPRLSEDLPVVSEVTETLADGTKRVSIVEMQGTQRTFPTPRSFTIGRILDQMTLHFSIGQAF